MTAVVRSYCMDRDRELALVEGVRAGDELAFDAVYQMFNARLLGFLVRLAGSRDVGEELLEETWLRFLRHANRLQPDTRLGPWLFTVARNLHVSYCRSMAIEANAVITLSLWPEVVRDTPYDVAARHQFEERVESALAALPVTLREALLLVGVEEMQPSEAALVCGVTPEAMRQRVRRARVLLAQRLNLPAGDLRLKAGA